MKTANSKIESTSFQLALTLLLGWALLDLGVQPMKADTVTAFFQTNAAMVANIEEDMSLLTIQEGPMVAPVTFSSQIDPNTMSYSYSMTTGSTYNGMPAALTANGSFDSSTGQWNSTTNATIGSASWQAAGSTSFTGSTTFASVAGSASSGLYSANDGVTWYWNPVTNRWESVGWVLVIDNKGHPHYQLETDDSENDFEKWVDHEAWGVLNVSSTNDFNTGFGTFVVSATPEPSSLALVGCGVISLSGILRRRLLSRT